MEVVKKGDPRTGIGRGHSQVRNGGNGGARRASRDAKQEEQTPINGRKLLVLKPGVWSPLFVLEDGT